MSASFSPDRDDLAAEPRSIDLREYWLIARRRWVLILIMTLVGAAAGLGYAKSSGKTFSATAQVVVVGLTQGPVNSSTQGNLQVNMSTEQAVAQSSPVIDQAAKTLGIQQPTLQTETAKRLTVTVPGTSLTTSNVLQITWTSGSAHYAQAGANAFANAYLSYRHRELTNQIANLESVLKGQLASLETQISQVTGQLGTTSSSSPSHQNLTIKLNELTGQASTAGNQLASLPTYNVSGGSVIAAALPAAPSGISRTVVLAIGALLGLLIGLALAFVRDLFDDRLRDTRQLERDLGVATLAVLPPVNGAPGKGWGSDWSQESELAMAAMPDSRFAEAVRSLRVTLAAVADRRHLRTVLVVGADASVSAGYIVAELGVAFAQSDRRVLLVAADMRASVLPQIFGIEDSAGLSDLLVDGGNLQAACRKPGQAPTIRLPALVAQRLAVLSSGSRREQALSLLDSNAMIDIMERQRDAYDLVLLDAPPAAVASDVFAFAAHVDGVVVVAHEGRTSDRSLADLRRRLDQVGMLLIGSVFISRGRSRRYRHRPPGAHRSNNTPNDEAEVSPVEQADGESGPAKQPDPFGNGVQAGQPDPAGNGGPAEEPEQANDKVQPEPMVPLPIVRGRKSAGTSGNWTRPLCGRLSATRHHRVLMSVKQGDRVKK